MRRKETGFPGKAARGTLNQARERAARIAPRKGSATEKAPQETSGSGEKKEPAASKKERKLEARSAATITSSPASLVLLHHTEPVGQLDAAEAAAEGAEAM